MMARSIPTNTERVLVRVLMLATYFPKPSNPLMGTWALQQAQALGEHSGITLKVVSFSSWVPQAASLLTSGAGSYANCPGQYTWDGLPVEYPKWLWYPIAPVKNWEYRRPVPFLRIAFTSARRYLDKLISDYRPDVIYAHHSAVNGYLALQIKRRYGVPFVVTDHDFGEIQDCSSLPARKALFQEIVNESACMVAVSRRMEQILKDLFPQARTRTVHNGTLDLVPAYSTAEPHSQDTVTVFSCGAFYERKGFPLLVEAFAAIARKHPMARLRIAGDGAQRRLTEMKAHELGIADRVTFLGFLPHADVIQEMRSADIFALIGWDEPFGVVFAEAMAAGRAIICAKDCGITDILEDGVHGLTVQPHSLFDAVRAMETLVTEPFLRAKMGASGRNLFERQLTWQHNAQTMHEIFTEALRDKSL